MHGRIWLFYKDFKIKSSENSCKGSIFVILYKIDLNHKQKRTISMCKSNATSFRSLNLH